MALPQVTSGLVHPALVLLVLASSACAEPNQGLVGAVDACPIAIEEYEQATRLQESPLTGVVTSVADGTGGLGESCCLDEHMLSPLQLLNGRTLKLPVDAVRYPWFGHCWDASDNACDSCNLCPYGASYMQGTWVDTHWGMPMLADDEHNGQANRLDVDGNTFRWRYKERRTGHWVDFRGYLYCPATWKGWTPYHVFVPTEVSRGEGTPCEFDPATRSGPHEPFPRIEVGKGIAINMALAGQHAALRVSPAWQVASTPTGPEMIEAPHFDRSLCPPGVYIGPPSVDYEGLAIETFCPELETFTACWEADEQ